MYDNEFNEIVKMLDPCCEGNVVLQQDLKNGRITVICACGKILPLRVKIDVEEWNKIVGSVGTA